MGTGGKKIARLGDVTFQGKVGANVTAYAKSTQRLARDLAAQIEADGARAEREMRRLDGHPLLVGVDVRLRARIVRRRFKRAKELALAISAESVKFQAQYRRDFLATPAQQKNSKRKTWSKDVDL
ncbi:hypothetical protein BJF79_30700 [Actinomadura sp. CNU-125]|uniref:hypothetical protein n=1 Tax=Actinomadura sp. CNU-125 TaxID=1904961 RepID=UPI000961E033|nr:hypothetical protein [Actinomadura sp. CNU-125]OLT36743.1 hypothetical protein BJF79_30700 [Actinomadura sp. CNU-125]